MEREAEAIKSRALNELSAGQKDEEGVCSEAPDKMCPEGTMVTTKRRRNLARGAGVTTAAYIFGKFVISPLGAVAGTAVGGPAGSVPGFLAASAMASSLAMASGYWASLGPKECG